MDESRRLKRVNNSKYNAVIAMILMVAVLTFTYAGFYTVAAHERAVVTQFGRVIDVRGSGSHFRLPLIQRIHFVPVYIQSTGSYMQLKVTADFNLLKVEVFAQWQIYDPRKYLFAIENPRELLSALLAAEARGAVLAFYAHEVLATERHALTYKITQNLMARLFYHDIGIAVTNVILGDVRLPTDEVNDAFLAAEAARVSKLEQINAALAYASEILPSARAEANRIIAYAEFDRDARIAAAQSQARRFEELFLGYSQNPDLARTRMYLEAMERILPGVRLYIE